MRIANEPVDVQTEKNRRQITFALVKEIKREREKKKSLRRRGNKKKEENRLQKHGTGLVRARVIKMNAILFTFWLFVVFPSFAAQRGKVPLASSRSDSGGGGGRGGGGRKGGGGVKRRGRKRRHEEEQSDFTCDGIKVTSDVVIENMLAAVLLIALEIKGIWFHHQ